MITLPCKSYKVIVALSVNAGMAMFTIPLVGLGYTLLLKIGLETTERATSTLQMSILKLLILQPSSLYGSTTLKVHTPSAGKVFKALNGLTGAMLPLIAGVPAQVGSPPSSSIVQSISD